MKNFMDARIVHLELNGYGGEDTTFICTDPDYDQKFYAFHFMDYAGVDAGTPTLQCIACDSEFITLKRITICPICGCEKIMSIK